MNSPETRFKGLLETGNWFQCQGLPEEVGGDDLTSMKGHAIFHVSNEGKIDLIVFADRESLDKKGREPSYPVDSLILPRVTIDFGNAQGHERCSSCAQTLERHQKKTKT